MPESQFAFIIECVLKPPFQLKPESGVLIIHMFVLKTVTQFLLPFEGNEKERIALS